MPKRDILTILLISLIAWTCQGCAADPSEQRFEQTTGDEPLDVAGEYSDDPSGLRRQWSGWVRQGLEGIDSRGRTVMLACDDLEDMHKAALIVLSNNGLELTEYSQGEVRTEEGVYTILDGKSPSFSIIRKYDDGFDIELSTETARLYHVDRLVIISDMVTVLESLPVETN